MFKVAKSLLDQDINTLRNGQARRNRAKEVCDLLSKTAVLETKQRLFQVYSALAEWNQQEIAWNQDEWTRDCFAEGVARKELPGQIEPFRVLSQQLRLVHFYTEKLCVHRKHRESE